MSTPVNPATDKVEQQFLPISLKPSSPSRFPIVYADNAWDVIRGDSPLLPLSGATGQFDQHTLNELLALAIGQQADSIEWETIGATPPAPDEDIIPAPDEDIISDSETIQYL